MRVCKVLNHVINPTANNMTSTLTFLNKVVSTFIAMSVFGNTCNYIISVHRRIQVEGFYEMTTLFLLSPQKKLKKIAQW